MEALKFKQLPSVIMDLKNEVREMKALLLQKVDLQTKSDNYFNKEELNYEKKENNWSIRTKNDYQNKVLELKVFVKKSKYFDTKEQLNICNHFGLPYLKNIFQDEYRNRFFEYLKETTTTVATVSKVTEIPHKYLCICKSYYEKKGMLKVVSFGKCPTTGSNNVQFITTNKLFFNISPHISKSTQLILF